MEGLPLGDELRRVSRISFSMRTFPAVEDVIFRLSSMGTPPEMSVVSVRVTREMATFFRRLPKSGTLRSRRSTVQWPEGVFR